eukprot:1157302-Pelagomonas_calceolata.AAC.10
MHPALFEWASLPSSSSSFFMRVIYLSMCPAWTCIGKPAIISSLYAKKGSRQIINQLLLSNHASFSLDKDRKIACPARNRYLFPCIAPLNRSHPHTEHAASGNLGENSCKPLRILRKSGAGSSALGHQASDEPLNIFVCMKERVTKLSLPTRAAWLKLSCRASWLWPCFQRAQE